jgi:hypothetical protein
MILDIPRFRLYFKIDQFSIVVLFLYRKGKFPVLPQTSMRLKIKLFEKLIIPYCSVRISPSFILQYIKV